VCIDAVLEAIAAASLIAANAYCTGYSGLPSLGSFDYCINGFNF